MKKQLRFKKDKPFRIFLMSDLHGGKGVSDQLPEAIEAVMAKYEPDLVLLGGDTAGCGPVHVETEQDLREYLDIITEPMNKRNIPWAHVFDKSNCRIVLLGKGCCKKPRKHHIDVIFTAFYTCGKGEIFGAERTVKIVTHQHFQTEAHGIYVV